MLAEIISKINLVIRKCRWKTFSANPCSVYPLFSENLLGFSDITSHPFFTNKSLTLAKSSILPTSNRISTIFLAQILGTAVLPICSILLITFVPNIFFRFVFSDSYQSFHSDLCSTRKIGKSCQSSSKLISSSFFIMSIRPKSTLSQTGLAWFYQPSSSHQVPSWTDL